MSLYVIDRDGRKLIQNQKLLCGFFFTHSPNSSGELGKSDIDIAIDAVRSVY